MKISVIQEDIDKGIRCAAGQCALALAIRRCAGLTDCIVGVSTICCTNDEEAPEIQLPPEAAIFRHSFDCGLTVTPFEFELEVPAC